MQKSGFFNALRTVNGDYDRKYNADDYCDNLAVVISNGVLRGVDNDLRVTASGLVVSVGKGRAWINGHYYCNDTEYYFAATRVPLGGARYDRVFLRLNKSLAVRSITLVYAEGEAGNYPTPPAPVRNGDIYDLVLADIYTSAGSTSINSIYDRRPDEDLCGWVYSTIGNNSFFTSLDAAFNEWFEETKTEFENEAKDTTNEMLSWFGDVKDTFASVTLFKRYNWRTVLTNAGKTVTFNIPQYDTETCFIEVFINGIVSTENVDYSATGNVITFTNSLVAGTEIEVKCYKSIDGTGIQSVSDEITALQNAVASIDTESKYEYICNGVNDNVALSQIAQALKTGTYNAAEITPHAAAFLDKWGGVNGLADIASNASIKISVYGSFGASAPYAGDGTEAAGYQWLSLGTKDSNDRTIMFDFSAVETMLFNCRGNAKNIIFYGADVHIIGANVQAAGSTANANVIMFSGRAGVITAENCKFNISTTGTATVAESGTFINCKTWITSANNAATTFAPVSNSRPVIVYGGTHYAYCADAVNYHSSVFYTAINATNAVIMAYGVNLPTVAFSTFYQTNAARINAGKIYISGITTTLAISNNEFCETNGHIAINKA